MNKEQFKQKLELDGFKDVPESTKWQRVSAPELEVQRFDINNVWDPKTHTHRTISVNVINENTEAEEVDLAAPADFAAAIAQWLLGVEDSVSALWSTGIEKIYPETETAHVSAILEVNGEYLERSFAVKRRNGTFSYVEFTPK